MMMAGNSIQPTQQAWGWDGMPGGGGGAQTFPMAQIGAGMPGRPGMRPMPYAGGAPMQRPGMQTDPRMQMPTGGASGLASAMMRPQAQQMPQSVMAAGRNMGPPAPAAMRAGARLV